MGLAGRRSPPIVGFGLFNAGLEGVEIETLGVRSSEGGFQTIPRSLLGCGLIVTASLGFER